MTSDSSWFDVGSDEIPLAALVDGGSLVAIDLNRHGARKANGSMERRVATEMAEYLRGQRTEFEVPFALHGSHFQLIVWNALLEIPYGTTVAYGELANRLGKPAAARAVGAANGRNPIPIVVPCHRVIAAGGALGGYGGGLILKRRLLALEGAMDQQLSAI